MEIYSEDLWRPILFQSLECKLRQGAGTVGHPQVVAIPVAVGETLNHGQANITADDGSLGEYKDVS